MSVLEIVLLAIAGTGIIAYIVISIIQKKHPKKTKDDDDE